MTENMNFQNAGCVSKQEENETSEIFLACFTDDFVNSESSSLCIRLSPSPLLPL